MAIYKSLQIFEVSFREESAEGIIRHSTILRNLSWMFPWLLHKHPMDKNMVYTSWFRNFWPCCNITISWFFNTHNGLNLSIWIYWNQPFLTIINGIKNSRCLHLKIHQESWIIYIYNPRQNILKSKSNTLFGI